MKDAGNLLQALGFTEYEARAYLALLGVSDRNGYEVAKASGIPRANIYPVLERLVSRDAARRSETRAGRRYRATPPERLLARLERAHQSNLKSAQAALAELDSPSPVLPVFNLSDRSELLAQARELLAEVETDLLVALQPDEAAALAPDLAAARERGVRITTLCMEACKSECGGCVGGIYRYNLAPAGKARWFIVVADGQRVLAGEMRAGAAHAIATEQPLIVELATGYIRQSLALAAVAGALGERFDGLLSESARKLLDDLHPGEGFFAWLHRVAGSETA